MKKQDLKTSAIDIDRPCEHLSEVKLTKKASKIFMQNNICVSCPLRKALWYVWEKKLLRDFFQLSYLLHH